MFSDLGDTHYVRAVHSSECSLDRFNKIIYFFALIDFIVFFFRWAALSFYSVLFSPGSEHHF
jgi:hypothetical protein